MNGRTLKLGLATLIVLELPACLKNDARPVQYAELRHRAAFDLHCEESALKVTPLKENEGSSCTTEFHSANVAGVTCSERRATYVWAHGAGTWVQNTDAQREK